MKSPSLFLLLTAVVSADLRSSVNFRLTTEATVPGQPRQSSPRFACDSASDPLNGISQTSGTSGQPVFTVKLGYVAQLYDASGLSLLAVPNPVAETRTTQLTPAASADDGTGLNLTGTANNWTILSGPVTSINATGLATTDIVRQDEIARVQAIVAGKTVVGNFTILDAFPDNFPPLANDGLADRWQFHHFDPDGDGTLDDPALASPNADPDGDGLTNFEEAAFGLSPLLPSPPPLTFALDPENDTLLLWWTRPMDSLGISVIPQWSDALENWYDSQVGPLGGPIRTFTSFQLDPIPGEDGEFVQLWQAHLNPISDAESLFARLLAR